MVLCFFLLMLDSPENIRGGHYASKGIGIVYVYIIYTPYSKQSSYLASSDHSVS